MKPRQWCENEWCVYYENDFCALEVIEMNAFGSCDSCIMVELPGEVLEKGRLEQRAGLDRRDGK